MNGKDVIRHHMDGVFVLLLFAIFAGCVLMVLLFGASSYEKLVERDNNSFEYRTGAAYVAAKVRHNDVLGMVQVGSFSDRNNREADDINTLYLQYIDEEGVPVEGYYTKIYCCDGYLREVLCEEGISLKPENGSRIMEATDFSCLLKNGAIDFQITYKNKESNRMRLKLRSIQQIAREEQL